MKIIVNDQLVNYSDVGSGEVILFLHGWGTSHATFNDYTKDFSSSYRVISIDFPGFGASPIPANSWYVDNYAQFVRDFIQKLKIESVRCVVGHSFGGRVTIKMMGNQYIQAGKIILIGSAGVKPKRSLQKIFYTAVAKIGKQVVKLPFLSVFKERLRRRLYTSSGSTDYLEAKELQPIFLNVIREDLMSDARNITAPALLIWGENDTETPVEDARKLHAAIKGSALSVLPDAGHFVYVEQFTKTVALMKDFIK